MGVLWASIGFVSTSGLGFTPLGFRVQGCGKLSLWLQAAGAAARAAAGGCCCDASQWSFELEPTLPVSRDNSFQGVQLDYSSLGVGRSRVLGQHFGFRCIHWLYIPRYITI